MFNGLECRLTRSGILCLDSYTYIGVMAHQYVDQCFGTLSQCYQNLVVTQYNITLSQNFVILILVLMHEASGCSTIRPHIYSNPGIQLQKINHHLI